MRPFRIAHISDVHVFSFPSFFQASSHSPIRRVFERFRWWVQSILLTKRSTGYVNLRYRRGFDAFPTRVLESALSSMFSETQGDAQHCIVSGDVTNLGLQSEFERARSLFQEKSPSLDMLSFCPGNHDVYTKRQRKEGAVFEDFFPQIGIRCQLDSESSSDLTDPLYWNASFPVLRMIRRKNNYMKILESFDDDSPDADGVDILLLTSAYPRPPFVAAGRIGTRQWNCAKQLLEQRDEHYRSLHFASIKRPLLFVLHHPPVRREEDDLDDRLHDLADEDRLVCERFCDTFSVSAVLNGHTHKPLLIRMNNRNQTLVCDPGSGTLLHQDSTRRARYWVYEFSDNHLTSIEERSLDCDWNPIQIFPIQK